MFVEAIETLFVPVAIQNNAAGEDARTLERFGEPAWNNPVVRFLDARGTDVIPRADGVWASAALASRMSAALVAAKCELPEWWKLAELDARVDELPRVVIAMHCFWVGQAKLGALEGIADARPAFLEGLEVVDVRYDPRRLPLTKLIEAAKGANVADRVWVSNDEELVLARKVLGVPATKIADVPRAAPDSDDLRALKASRWAKHPLPRALAVQANARFAAGEGPPLDLLSPRQRASMKTE